MAYAHGLITWTDISLSDPASGSTFYSELFGWDAQDQFAPDGSYIYTMFSKGGQSVAGLGPQPAEMAESGIPPMWNTYVNVDNVDDTIAQWIAAGGSVMVPAMDVMTAGRMAFVADPEGAVLALWQAGDHVGGEVFNEHGALTWNELNTRDSAAAREFYGAALGWEFEKFGGDEAPMEYWLIRVPGKVPGAPLADDELSGGFLTMDENWPADLPAHWMVYFHVDDTDAAVAKLEELGGTVSVPAFDSSAGRIAVVSDPQGGTFSVISPPQPTDA
jgi:predicted enzyme related to lactoylglutathione lyase